MNGQNRKQVNAILRKVAKKAELAKAQSVTCTACRTRIEQWWNYCAMCGWHLASGPEPSYTDPPFGCPPDEEAK